MSDANDRDAVWRRAELQSPCVQICMLHPGAKICVGCGRTGEEIARWSRYSGAERDQVLAELPARMERLRAPEARPSRRRAARRAADET